MRAPHRPQALLLTLALALAVCGALAAGAAAQGPDLSGAVSLGDSYSSGEGSGPPFDPGTNVPRDRCHRSVLAWPRLLGVPAGRHLACSGATIAALTAGSASIPPDDAGQVARLAALPDPPSYVLVTLGGNDAGFAGIFARCVVGSCVAPARAGVGALPALGARLEAAYRAIAAAARGGRVVVVGYPEIAPAGRRAVRRCPWLTPADVAATLRFTRRLDATIAAAAARAGVAFLTVGDALRGHELCTAASWVFPVLHPLSRDPRQGHPRPAGQAAIAARVAAFLAAAS